MLSQLGEQQVAELSEKSSAETMKKFNERPGTVSNARCEQIKSQLSEVKAQVRSTAKGIVEEAKEKGLSLIHI